MVTWSYIHTGGLPLTNIHLSYSHSILGNSTEKIVTNSPQLNTVSVMRVDSTSVVVPSLVTGVEYTFNVTAENSYGSSSIVCGPIPHIIGKTECQQYIEIYHWSMHDKISCFYQCIMGLRGWVKFDSKCDHTGPTLIKLRLAVVFSSAVGATRVDLVSDVKYWTGNNIILVMSVAWLQIA